MLDPALKSSGEQARGLFLIDLGERRIDPCLDRSLAQDLGAQRVDGADNRFLEASDRAREVGAPIAILGHRARTVELLAQSQLELPGGLLGEGDRDHLVDPSAAGGKHLDQAFHQDRGLACAGGRLDQDASAQVGADALTGGVIVCRIAHEIDRILVRGSSRTLFLRRNRVCS